MSDSTEPTRPEAGKPAAGKPEANASDPTKAFASKPAAKPAPDKSEAKTQVNRTQPFEPGGTGPKAPVDNTPNRWAPAEGTPAPRAGQMGSPYTPPPPKRTSAQIRADIENQRQELGGSVDALRDKVTEITDWRSQLKKHRKQIIVGAVATGFVVGGLMTLRRR